MVRFSEDEGKPDLLDAGRYPTIEFRSTSVERSGDALRIGGDLTIRDVTRPIAFDARLAGVAVGMSGARRAAFSAELTLDRRDWGVTWNVPLGGDAVLVGTELTLTFDFTFEEVDGGAAERTQAAA